MGVLDGAWCILRTAGRSTLPLAASLGRAGFTVWTPARVMAQRLPRRKTAVERTVPIMPTFLFARAFHVPALVGLEGSNARDRDHESFSVFRYLGRIPLVADAELEALRSEENRVAPKQKQRVFGAGDRVRVPQGSFGGMTGLVEASDRRYTLVCFGGIYRVKISTFLLRMDELEQLQPTTGIAAQAA